MVYQIAVYQGDLLGLNAQLQNMQLTDLSEIVDVILISDNNYLIKYKMQQTSTSWWTNFLNNF
jgi:hypothetical protein